MADDPTLELAARVAAALREEGAEPALIGAMALAVHGFVRATADLDLAVVTDPNAMLRPVARRLRAEGLDCELVLPDADDPLGGVLTVRGGGADPVQVVNFLNPFRARNSNPGIEAVATATEVAGLPFRVVDIPHLVALKLWAGGPKSALDVSELLGANPNTSLAGIDEVCARFGLTAAWQSIRPLDPGRRP